MKSSGTAKKESREKVGKKKTTEQKGSGKKPADGKKKTASDDELKKKRSQSKDCQRLSLSEQNANRAKWAKRVSQLKCKDISTEFNEKIKRYVVTTLTADVCQKNDAKNRYADVLCLDATRVVLRDWPDDFIHASWVKIPDGTAYICTQGPLTETIEDFWQMCYQERASIILMLCDFFEGSETEKCCQYFPQDKGQQNKYDMFTITNKAVLDDLSEVEGIKVCTMEIAKRHSKPVTTKHVFMKSWPDQLAPVDAAPFLALWKWVKLNYEGLPVVVHCSAGVGRTSTFVGFELANYRIAYDPSISLMDIVKELRSMRYQSIQSHVQFLYLHICLIEYYIAENIIDRDGKEQDFIEEYRKHAQRKLEKAKGATQRTQADAPGKRKVESKPKLPTITVAPKLRPAGSTGKSQTGDAESAPRTNNG